MTRYYCAHCAQARPLKGGYIPTDERFAIVRCSGHDYPAHISRTKALDAMAVETLRHAKRKDPPEESSVARQARLTADSEVVG